MLVVNKRYYDYDYDNNTIVMFDAEDVALTLDLDDVDYLSIDNNQFEDDQLQPTDTTDNDVITEEKQQLPSKQLSSSTKDPMTSQSTDTIPDDIQQPPQPDDNNSTNTPSDKPLESPSNTPKLKIANGNSNSNSNSIYSNGNSHRISWISNNSPKGSKRIPYALHIAHSYTINRLPVQLTTLVNTKQLKKQKQKLKAKQLAAQQQYIQQQQQQQQQHHYYNTYHHPHPAVHPSHNHPTKHHYTQYIKHSHVRPYPTRQHAPPHTHTHPTHPTHPTHTQYTYPHPNHAVQYHSKKQEISAASPRYGHSGHLRSPPQQYITSYQK